METLPNSPHCPICGGNAPLLDAVDFNKCCEEPRGTFLPPAGVPVDYHLCDACGFCFAPGFRGWSRADFAERIYNAGYAEVDPDYAETRPRQNAQFIDTLFAHAPASLRHLDYGGGTGLVTECLLRLGWDSTSYDPFADATDVAELGRYDLITAFEVFEHVPDVAGTLRELAGLMADDCLVLFSTVVSDGEIARNRRLTWWYASPRNGHISLFSRRSLTLALGSLGLKLESFSPACHVAFRDDLPGWARHLLAPA